MGLDNDAFRKFLEDKKPAGAQKKNKATKKKVPATGKPGKKNAAAAEEDDGPKYRCEVATVDHILQMLTIRACSDLRCSFMSFSVDCLSRLDLCVAYVHGIVWQF